MKYKIFTIGMLLGVFAFQSCTEEDLEKGTPLEPGAEIQFGATLPDDDMTRTYYGPEDGPEGGRYWPIYWNYEGARDEIFIYSPQANSGRNQATFRVMANSKDLASAAEVEKVGAAGIQAGSNTQQAYDFYAMYPASAVKGQATGTTISGTLSGSQTVTLDPTTAGAAAKKMKPDMNNCLMLGTGHVDQLTNAKVGIQFKPFVSTLDITVNGPNTTGATAKVTSVEITTSKGSLTGDFDYDFSGTGTLKVTSAPTDDAAADPTKSLTIYTPSSTDNGITLVNGQTLNLQAFILPNNEVSDLKVTVNAIYSDASLTTPEARNWTKTLTVTPAQISSSKVLKVVLDRIPDTGTLNLNSWISQLDSHTYISEISLPGSALSWNMRTYGVTNSRYQTQSVDIASQFKAGIRVFQAHAWLSSQISHLDNQAPSLQLIASYPQGQIGTGRQLYDAVKVLTDEMKANHSKEFCVLMLSDYNNNNSYSYEQFYSRLKVLVDKMVADGLVAGNITPETTIEDVKSKVIIKIQLNNDHKADWAQLKGADVLMNTYLNGTLNAINTSIRNPGANNSVWYSQLTFGYGNGIADGGVNATGSLEGWPMAFIYTEQANPCTSSAGVNDVYVTALRNNINAYKQYYNQYGHKIFGMTYLGGTGYDGVFNYYPVDVTTTYIDTWNSTWGDNTTQPYGWVMFNEVGGNNTTINNAIQKVINQNFGNGTTSYKPGTKPVTNTALNDATSKNKGPLFGMRRR